MISGKTKILWIVAVTLIHKNTVSRCTQTNVNASFLKYIPNKRLHPYLSLDTTMVINVKHLPLK